MLNFRRTSGNGNDSGRRAAEGVIQAFTVATQMALLSPPGVDEWVRQELGGDRGDPRRGRRGIR